MQKTRLSNGSKRKRKKYTQSINIILKSSPKRRGIFPQIQTLKGTEEQKTETKETSEEPRESRTKSKANKVTTGTNYSTGDFNQLKRNTKLYEKFESVAKNLRDNNQFPAGTEDNVKEYFIANELVQGDYDALGNPIFNLTFKGRQLYKDFYNDKYVD